MTIRPGGGGAGPSRVPWMGLVLALVAAASGSAVLTAAVAAPRGTVTEEAAPSPATAPGPTSAQDVHGDHRHHAPPDSARRSSRPSEFPAWPEGSASTLRVGQGERFATIGDGLEAASAGDTVRVGPGTYRERLRVSRAVALVGEGAPVVDAGGRGHVVEASAPLLIRGFVLRGSGTNVDTEDAGVMVRGAVARVEHNRIEDVLYGVYLKEAPGSRVAHNHVTGKELPPSRRGDGIRLWYSSGTRILSNRVERTRDVVIFFSDSLEIRDNHVSDGRYGLHYMYSNDNVFEGNRFVGNDVGAFLMYSSDIRFRRNVFAESRGASGFGVGLKDADRVEATDNLWVENQVGVYLDNSPRSRDDRNAFTGNLFLFNDAGVRLLPSVRGNDFRGNDFVANDRPAEVAGAGGRGEGVAARNRWEGNHWDGYAGFDRDGDGRGESPYVHARLSDRLVVRHPELRLFAWSPAFPVVDAVSRFFPLMRPAPSVVDSAPRLEARVLDRWERRPPATLALPPAGPDSLASAPGRTP